MGRLPGVDLQSGRGRKVLTSTILPTYTFIPNRIYGIGRNWVIKLNTAAWALQLYQNYRDQTFFYIFPSDLAKIEQNVLLLSYQMPYEYLINSFQYFVVQCSFFNSLITFVCTCRSCHKLLLWRLGHATIQLTLKHLRSEQTKLESRLVEIHQNIQKSQQGALVDMWWHNPHWLKNSERTHSRCNPPGGTSITFGYKLQEHWKEPDRSIFGLMCWRGGATCDVWRDVTLTDWRRWHRRFSSPLFVFSADTARNNLIFRTLGRSYAAKTINESCHNCRLYLLAYSECKYHRQSKEEARWSLLVLNLTISSSKGTNCLSSYTLLLHDNPLNAQ